MWGVLDVFLVDVVGLFLLIRSFFRLFFELKVNGSVTKSFVDRNAVRFLG